MYLALVPLKGGLASQLPPATGYGLLQEVLNSQAFLASWAKEQSAEWVLATSQPFLHLKRRDAGAGSWKGGLHAPKWCGPGCLL